MPDYIKKVTILRNLNLKKTMEYRQFPMQVMQKVPAKGCFYITCLLIFMQNVLPIIRHIFLLFLSNCSNSTLVVHFLNQYDQYCFLKSLPDRFFIRRGYIACIRGDFFQDY